MKATINEVIRNVPADDWEIYKGDHFHTDYCSWVNHDKVDKDAVMDLVWEIMDEGRYDSTILVNTSEFADFGDRYGDPEAKVLCILIKEEPK